MQAEAGDFLLDAHHDVGVILISLKLVGQAHHAVPNKLVLSRQVRLDCLQHQGSFQTWSHMVLIMVSSDSAQVSHDV